MSNGSVGEISLDLIIKDRIGEQLEKIKSSVRSPAEKIGEQINNSVSKSMDNVKKTFEKMSSVDPFSLQAQKAELMSEKLSILTNKISSMEEELQQCEKAFEFEEDISTIDSLSKRYDRLSASINNARLQQVNLEKQLAGMSGVDLKGTQGQIFEEKIIAVFQKKISEIRQ